MSPPDSPRAISTAVLFYSQVGFACARARARAGRTRRGDGLSVTILEASDSIFESRGCNGIADRAAAVFVARVEEQEAEKREEEATLSSSS